MDIGALPKGSVAPLRDRKAREQGLFSGAYSPGSAGPGRALSLSEQITWAILIFIACFLGALLCVGWTRDAGVVSSLWPANAVALAALLYRTPPERLAILVVFTLAVTAANLVHGDGWGLSLLLAAANLVEVVIALGLILRILGEAPSLREPGVFLRLLGLAGVLAPVVGASMAAAIMHVSVDASFVAVWKTWWSGHAIGILVFFAIWAHILARQFDDSILIERRLEAVLTLTFLCVIVWFAFQGGQTYSLLALLPALLWVAVRFATAGSAAALALTAMLLTILTVQGYGPIGLMPGLSEADRFEELNFVLLTLALPTLMIALVLDKQRGLNRALRHSDDRYRRLYDDSPVMLHSIDSAGRLVSVSRYWLDKMGYRREEVLGRKSIDFLDEESRRRALDEVQPRLVREGSVTDVEYRFVKKDGETFDTLLSAIQERDERTGDTRSLTVIVDISARKAAEKRLAETIDELARSNRDLEQFAYLASHDLQEPLRMVSSFTNLLQEEYASKLDDQAKEYIHFAHDGAVRMSQLLQDVLTFSRITRDPSETEQVDLGAIVNIAVAELQTSIEEASAIVSSEELPTVPGNPVQLTSLFRNLIGNSLKYRSEAPAVISISAAPREGGWQVTVADNGIGIDPKHFERIFGLFKRLHARGDYDGTGIGLAICKKVVEQHEGRIWVESEPGRGSRFHFTIPAGPLEEDRHGPG